MDDRHPYPAMACAPSHGGDRAGLSRSLQIVSGTDRRAFPDGRARCGGQCAEGEAGGAGGGLAMVEWMATDPRGSEADDLAQCVAGRAATRLGGAYESASDGIGVRGASRECATGPPVWRRRVGPPNGQTFWHGVDDTVPWATEGIMREDSCLSSLHIDVMRAPKRRVFSAPSRILAQNLRLSHCR